MINNEHTSSANLAILVDNLGPNQLSYSGIFHVNNYLSKNFTPDILFMCENMVRPVADAHFAVMNICEGYNFNGITVATNLSTAYKSLGFPTPIKRYFYVWDLEWVRKPISYEMVVGIYRNPKLELIARSYEHKNILEYMWNREVKAVVEDLNIEQLLKVTHG